MNSQLIIDYKKLLADFVGIKSIAADSSFKPEIFKAVKWLSDLFVGNGFAVKEIKGPTCNPIVFAEHSCGCKETILIYGHYDVQPAEIDGEWQTDPFKLIEKNGFLFGRGVLDNKGQILAHMVSIFELIKSGKLGYNIKFLIEGNEETGNDDMQQILISNKKLFESDYVMVSDGEIHGTTPLIEASLRGGLGMKIVIKNGNGDLHSGLYGGAVYNMGTILTNLFSTIVDANNNVLIPDFEKGVDKITNEQEENTSMMKAPSIKGLTLSSGENFYTKTALKPTIQVTGIKVGYVGEGFNNIVPGIAEGRINIRIVSSQDVNEIENTIRNHIIENLPKDIECEISVGGKHNPVKLDINSKIHTKAKIVLQKVFGKAPLIKYVGGAVPFVTDIKTVYGIDTLLVPLGNDGSQAHGPNENYSLDIINKGLTFSLDFFSQEK